MDKVHVRPISAYQATVFFYEGPVRYSFSVTRQGERLRKGMLYKRLPPPAEQVDRPLAPDAVTNREKIDRALKFVRDHDLINKAYADQRAEEERVAREWRQDQAAKVRRAAKRFAEEMEGAERKSATRYSAQLKEALHFLTDQEVVRLSFLIHEEGA